MAIGNIFYAMIKKLFAVALISACMFTLHATEKAKVYCEYFTWRSEVGQATAEQVRSAVMSGINETNRVELIDVASNESLQIEASRRSDASAIGDETARTEIMKTAGATHILQGFVSQVSVKKDRTTGADAHDFYTASVNYTLKMIEVATGKLKFSKDYNVGGGLTDLSTGSTPDEAVAEALKAVKRQMRDLMDEEFKLRAEILGEDFELDKKKAAMVSCYVTLGEGAGIEKGQQLEVATIKVIGGRETQKIIGTLKVEEVVADDLSKCKVTKGGDLIKAAMDEYLDALSKDPDNARPVQVITKKKTGLGATLGKFNL